MSDGQPGLVSHTFRVATAECTRCGRRARLYPRALVNLTTRRERKLSAAFLACPSGHLFPGDTRIVQPCPHCGAATDPDAAYTRGRSISCSCGHIERLHDRIGTWQWEVVLVERSRPGRRELALPTAAETAVAAESWSWPRIPYRRASRASLALLRPSAGTSPPSTLPPSPRAKPTCPEPQTSH
jgi:putative DNA methylase